MTRTPTLTVAFTAAICAGFLSLAWRADAAAEPDLRARCAQVYNSTIYNAYINSKGQLICSISDMEWGSAHRSKAKWDAQRAGRKKSRKAPASSGGRSCQGKERRGGGTNQC